MSRDPLGPVNRKQGKTQWKTRPGNVWTELERKQWEPLKLESESGDWLDKGMKTIDVSKITV